MRDRAAGALRLWAAERLCGTCACSRRRGQFAISHGRKPSEGTRRRCRICWPIGLTGRRASLGVLSHTDCTWDVCRNFLFGSAQLTGKCGPRSARLTSRNLRVAAQVAIWSVLGRGAPRFPATGEERDWVGALHDPFAYSLGCAGCNTDCGQERIWKG